MTKNFDEFDEWVEISASSKAEAIERACMALNTHRQFLKIENLGGGGKKIRAFRMSEPVAQTEEPSKPKRKGRNGKAKATPEDSPKPKAKTSAKGRGRGKGKDKTDADIAAEAKPDDALTVIEPSEKAEEGRVLLEELIRKITHEDAYTVQVEEYADEFYLEISGPESGVLIGRHGQTLEAMQHIVAKMLGLDSRTDKRISIDVEQYRTRRKAVLEELGEKLANRALREKRTVSAEPMNAMDRRVLHLVLAENENVTTKSIGEGRERRVLIMVKEGAQAPLREEKPKRSRGGRSRNGRSSDGDNNSSSSDGRRRTGRGSTSRNRRTTNKQVSKKREEGAYRIHDSFDSPPEPMFHLFREDTEFMDESILKTTPKPDVDGNTLDGNPKEIDDESQSSSG